MKVGVLTSSRADFGIYLPLLKLLKEDSFFNLEIIAFGTHLSQKHGYTISEINNYGFTKITEIDTLPASDSAENISKSIGQTIKVFSSFWENNKFDLVICLGDRFEMFAAVSSGTPFNIKFAHIHAGETTLGAIDNGYRHSISLFSDILFVSTNEYQKRADNLVDGSANVYNVGALSIDNLYDTALYSKKEFLKEFNIDLTKPTILSTFHPETVNFQKNAIYIDELLSTFDVLLDSYQIVITLPNIDTMGELIRDKIHAYKKINNRLIVIESFGMKGYLSCMKHCSLLLGNSSSGFVEASFFSKPVINLGERQRGRIITNNIFNTKIIKSEIIETIRAIESLGKLEKNVIYGDGKSAHRIKKIIKDSYGNN